MNTNLHIQLDNPTVQCKLLQYNIDMAVREEKYEATKWMNRKDRVAKLINSIDADIVCLQELRTLDGSISVNQFLSSMDKYHFKVEYRNPGPLSFGNAILYKPDKFYPLQTMKKWLSDTPHVVSDSYIAKEGDVPKGFGYIVMGVLFQRVENNKIVKNSKPFWVFNTHLGLDEKLKTESCYQLLNILCDLPFELLLTGDFNFFPDKDGAVQRKILTDANLQDLGKGAVTSSKGKQIEGTFVG
jgi:endonuclease/exonuclease/phosphatase family metal-dependent hydrolase